MCGSGRAIVLLLLMVFDVELGGNFSDVVWVLITRVCIYVIYGVLFLNYGQHYRKSETIQGMVWYECFGIND